MKWPTADRRRERLKRGGGACEAWVDKSIIGASDDRIGRVKKINLRGAKLTQPTTVESVDEEDSMNVCQTSGSEQRDEVVWTTIIGICI